MEIAQDLLHNGSFINGEWQQSPKNYKVSDPATEKTVAEVAYAGKNETEDAIQAAAQAFKSWRCTRAEQRCEILQRWSHLIKERSQDLAVLLTYEQGKPLSESLLEVQYAVKFLDWFAEEGRRNYGDIIPSHKEGSKLLVNKEPIGVVAAITPWNFPYAMVTRKLAPALAAGCSVVLKPSEETPLSALALAALAKQAELPAGLFNVVSGDVAAIGSTLMNSELVRKVSFTGSTRVGKLLMRQAAEHVKKLSLELGGNASFIVFEDADMQAAIKGALFAKFRNSGQTCVCVNRFYIHDNIYEQFVEQLSQEVSRLKLANGLTEGATQGPLINKAAHDKISYYVEDACAKGAKVLIGGSSSSLGGNFYQPTVLADAKQNMLLNREEIFGPVAACYRFSDETEVIKQANNTASGLAAYFYTRDLARIWRVSEALEVGIVGVNDGNISTEIAPFGGVKESGLGREGSKYGLDDYQEIKYTLLTI